MRNWRTAWYERHPDGLVGRLRRLLQSRPEAAHALIARLEREGWTRQAKSSSGGEVPEEPLPF